MTAIDQVTLFRGSLWNVQLGVYWSVTRKVRLFRAYAEISAIIWIA
ncbi:hypothetical protein [Acetobacter cerevisiae]|nr:hypothetical protein [Acetobacter cerevisiae]GBQ08427.1 hypothetical protein AA14362_1827 [Acetobacter cerevisiae DSM 14362]